MQTFRSEIKKVTQEIIPVVCQLIAPEHLTSQTTRLQFIKDKAATLLQGSQYLKGIDDDQVQIYRMFHTMKGY